MSTPLDLPIKLRKCLKPDCMRKVKEGIAYCCSPCATADEGKYEIHEHSEWCNQRNDERGECDEYEALLLRQ